MITPKDLLDASALARRLLFLKAQQATIDDNSAPSSPNLALDNLIDVARGLECQGGARNALYVFLSAAVAKQIKNTTEALREAGVDPDAEWPHAEGFR